MCQISFTWSLTWCHWSKLNLETCEISAQFTPLRCLPPWNARYFSCKRKSHYGTGWSQFFWVFVHGQYHFIWRMFKHISSCRMVCLCWSQFLFISISVHGQYHLVRVSCVHMCCFLKYPCIDSIILSDRRSDTNTASTAESYACAAVLTLAAATWHE